MHERRSNKLYPTPANGMHMQTGVCGVYPSKVATFMAVRTVYLINPIRRTPPLQSSATPA